MLMQVKEAQKGWKKEIHSLKKLGELNSVKYPAYHCKSVKPCEEENLQQWENHWLQSRIGRPR